MAISREFSADPGRSYRSMRKWPILALIAVSAWGQLPVPAKKLYVVFPPESGSANTHFTTYVMPQPAISGVTDQFIWNKQETTVDPTTQASCGANSDTCQKDSMGFYHTYNFSNADGILSQWFATNSGWGTKQVNILTVAQTNGPNSATPYYLTTSNWTTAVGIQHYINAAKDACTQDVGQPITTLTRTSPSNVATATMNNTYNVGDTIWVYGASDSTFNVTSQAGTTVLSASASQFTYTTSGTTTSTPTGAKAESQQQSWFVPTDPGYTVALDAFEAAVIYHFNHSASLSQIGYMRTGPVVRGAEMVMLCPDIMVSLGFPGYSSQAAAKTTWLNWYQARVNAVAAQNPLFQIDDTLNPGWTVTSPDFTYGLSMATSAIGAVNANGLRNGFGGQGLQAADIANYAIPPPPYCSSDWCEAANDYWASGVLSAGSQPIHGQQIDCSDPTAVWTGTTWTSGLQGVSCFQLGSGASSKSKTGDFRVLLPFLTAKHISTLELYNIDALLAYDPTYCLESAGTCGAGSVPAAVYGMRCAGTNPVQPGCPGGKGDGTYAAAFNTFANFGYQVGCTIPTCATGSFTIGKAVQGPPFYLSSTTSTANTGVLSSYFSGASTQNATALDAALGSINCITLATDSSSEPNGKSMVGSWSGGAIDLMWSKSFQVGGVTTWYVAAANVGAGISIYEVQLNASRCAQIVNTGSPAWAGITGPFAWNYTGIGDVRTFFHMKAGHILERYTVTDITTVGSPTTIVDYLTSSCPGSGLPAAGANWNSILIPAAIGGNQRFSLSIGGNGQGSAVWVFSYDTGLGCYTANMQTGKWYPFCTSSCGSEPSQNFTTTGNYCYGAPGGALNNIHDGQASMNGTVFRMSQTNGGSWTAGVCSGNTANDQDIALYIGTGNTDYTNGESNASAKCPAGVNCQFDNHPSEGLSTALSGMFLGYNTRPVSSYSGTFTTVQHSISSFTMLGINDSHGTWVHPNNDDTFPMYLVETDSNSTSQFFGCSGSVAAQCPSYLANEIIALPINGTNAVPIRFVHTHSSNLVPYAPSNAGNDSYFGPGNSIISCSPDGIMCSWPSSDFGAFGTDSGGQLHSHLLIVVLN